MVATSPQTPTSSQISPPAGNASLTCPTVSTSRARNTLALRLAQQHDGYRTHASFQLPAVMICSHLSKVAISWQPPRRFQVKPTLDFGNTVVQRDSQTWLREIEREREKKKALLPACRPYIAQKRPMPRFALANAGMLSHRFEVVERQKTDIGES